MLSLLKHILSLLIIFSCVSIDNLIAQTQQKLENEIISSLIKVQFKAHEPDTIYTRKGKIKKIRYFKVHDIVLVKETQTDRIRSNDSVIIAYLKKEIQDFDTDLYYDFKEKNLHPLMIDSIKDYKAKIYYTSKTELDKIIDKGNGWMSFYRQFHSSPFVEVSRPGINKLNNRALIYFSRGFGPLSGSGVFLLLELENNEWIEKGWSLVWIA
jgi:hypothetical protein